MTSNDLKLPQKIELIKPVSNEIDAVSTNHASSANRFVIQKGKIGSGGKIETDDENLDEIYDNNNL